MKTRKRSTVWNGYHVTEACVLTNSNHLVSIFSRIHSSSEKDYKSANTITFESMEQGAKLFKNATFAMDRGYDDNKVFLKMDELKQNYVIRLKSNRKLLYHNKWTTATELRNRRKVKTSVYYKGKEHVAYKSKSNKGKSLFLLLSVSKRYLRYTVNSALN